MFGQFYNSSLRRYIVMMGDLFSRIEVIRKYDEGTRYIKVPITYASKEKFIKKLNTYNSINSKEDVAKIETILPRLNLHLVDINYNAPFKTNTLNHTKSRTVGNKVTSLVSQYNPTPVKMIFELGIHTRHQDDMFQIVEQIIPYFQPHFNVRMTELHTNDIAIDRDIKVTMQSLSMDEDIEGEGNSRRRIEWSLIFEVNGWIYPPVREMEGEIRTIYLDFYSTSQEVDARGSFESIDHEVDPRDVSEVDWDENKKIKTGQSKDTPIPVAPEPPGVRDGDYYES